MPYLLPLLLSPLLSERTVEASLGADEEAPAKTARPLLATANTRCALRRDIRLT